MNNFKIGEVIAVKQEKDDQCWSYDTYLGMHENGEWYEGLDQYYECARKLTPEELGHNTVKPNEYLIGQRVIVNGEIGTVVISETGKNPFDIWVFLPSVKYSSCFSLSNVKPLPNGQL